MPNNQEQTATQFSAKQYVGVNQQFNNIQNNYAPPMQNAYYTQPIFQQNNEEYMRFYQKECEKQAVKASSGTAAKLTLVIFCLMQGLGIILVIVAMCCGVISLSDVDNSPYSGFTPLGYYLFTGMVSLVGIVFPVLILSKSTGISLDKLVPFKKIEGKYLAAICMAGISLCMLSQVIAVLFGLNMSLFGIDVSENIDQESVISVFDLLMGTLCTAILPALVEEFAFRGLVIGVLEKHGKLFAVFTSALLFGMLHGNFAQIPFAFTVGLVLGYVRIKTGSMYPSIIIHFANNFFAVLVTSGVAMAPENIALMIETVIMIALVIAGFVAFSYLSKNKKEFFEYKETKTLLSTKEKIQAFFSNGFVIADMIVLGGVALLLLLPMEAM